jgi:hypothetical protein
MNNMEQMKQQAIIGLVSVAIAHIDNEDADKARDTLLSLINTLERQVEA